MYPGVAVLFLSGRSFYWLYCWIIDYVARCEEMQARVCGSCFPARLREGGWWEPSQHMYCWIGLDTLMNSALKSLLVAISCVVGVRIKISINKNIFIELTINISVFLMCKLCSRQYQSWRLKKEFTSLTFSSIYIKSVPWINLSSN